MNDWQLTDGGNWTNGTAVVGLVHGDRGWRWGVLGTDKMYEHAHELWSDAVASAVRLRAAEPAAATQRAEYVKATRSRGGKKVKA